MLMMVMIYPYPIPLSVTKLIISVFKGFCHFLPGPSDDDDEMRSLIVITRWQDETAMGEDANMINLHV